MERTKQGLFLLILSILFGFISCTEGFESSQPLATNETTGADELTGLRATLTNFKNEYENLTRSAVIIDGDGDYQLVWAENDTIGIFPNQGFQVAFPMSSGAGSKDAVFDGGGWGLKSSSTYSAYCPMIGQFYLDKTKVPINMTGQVQTANNSTEHLSAYDYMCAINSTVDENGSVNFSFNHLVFILHLRLTMPQAGTYTSIVLETNSELTTEASLNLSDGNVKSKSSSEVFTLKLNNIELTTDNLVLDAYMALLPIDLTDKTFKAKIFDSENNCYEVTLKSRNYEAGTFYHQARTATVSSASLPVIMINTPSWQTITSKDVWIDKTSIMIRNVDGTVLEAPGKVKGRGNATWGYAKKPYAIKFSKKQSPFGFPENKSWVLLAEYNDRSLLRTPYMCAVSKAVGIEYTINYKHVNLYLNGEYQGIYLLTDKVEANDNRIKVNKDGYLIEHDHYYQNEPLYFVTNLNRGFTFKYPDADDGDIIEGDDNYLFIRDFVNSVEEKISVLSTNPDDTDYLNLIDLNSFAKYYIAAQVTATMDPNNYYVLTSKTSKLKRMPMWDAEWSLGLWATVLWGDAPNLINRNIWGSQPYFAGLVYSSVFKEEVKKEWLKFLQKINEIKGTISADAVKIAKAQKYNFAKWPDTGQVLNVHYDNWEDEVDYVNNYFDNRIEWMNYIQSW